MMIHRIILRKALRVVLSGDGQLVGGLVRCTMRAINWVRLTGWVVMHCSSLTSLQAASEQRDGDAGKLLVQQVGGEGRIKYWARATDGQPEVGRSGDDGWRRAINGCAGQKG
jgi:hypothetical protein